MVTLCGAFFLEQTMAVKKDKVKRTKINWKAVVKAAEPKRDNPVVYRFSNGREFKEKS